LNNCERNVIALLIIDMQVGLFTSETPRYDADGVVSRINAIGGAVRQSGGIVIFIQHDGPEGDPLEPGRQGWQLLPSLERGLGDVVVRKTACDAFYSTELKAVLDRRKVRRLIVTGCATDFCVDTTVRSAISRGYRVVVVADGHTTADRPHVCAASLIQHHNWLWQNLTHPKVRIDVTQTDDLIASCNNG
jgi:nicotinamidase-related amidase